MNALTERLGCTLPILQAPMAGAQDDAMTIEVSRAGGLGSLPCAMLSSEAIVAAVERIRAATDGPFALNFFCHKAPSDDPDRIQRWNERLAEAQRRLGVTPSLSGMPSRQPFGEAQCALLEEIRPAAVSFHFGLPEPALLERVRATGCAILASATTVEEAVRLDQHGCDAIIAQGFEAGGHRGNFLSHNAHAQIGTLSLVPQVVDAVAAPVVAAGGIADGRGVAAAMLLGASAVNVGTAYLRTPQARITPLHAARLAGARSDDTALTNVFTGRPARGLINRFMQDLDYLDDEVPEFPLASNAVSELRTAAEAEGSDDFSHMWCGQSAALAQEQTAGELTRALAADADDLLQRRNMR